MKCQVNVTHNHRPTNYGVGAAERNDFVGEYVLGNTLGIGFDITKIADMTNRILRCTMVYSGRVEVGSGRHTTICRVAKHMDVKTMFAGCEARDVNIDRDRSVFNLV
ncbi:hypothetical protein T265_08951 [Opisthorchis viverrini]|uniref:Uncharacterized protein n=1 Tax=Opisthorchis viverrini TaxID=6198 RepID=A0A074ZIG1_OPIVI|nr:hypothetical protein T265_08951 [Opisthorchis viverrini]KER23100.1 hypothetical protein T265_08951 [Opisthorchis viverrini]